ncbi:hypothetical protein [Sporosarcina beigongshangi]|uniref:hypothetical protein n=1 Tax=Sporosarcina beigongshangi TaxID=2782538 RepID=UPI00193A1E69|nr:hypothetical protein [Sporosarcina beigongshangi]
MRTRKTTHVILGVCMQTGKMAEMLEDAGATDIAVVDYDAEEDHVQVAKVHFYSPNTARRTLGKSKQIIFHKYLVRKKE